MQQGILLISGRALCKSTRDKEDHTRRNPGDSAHNAEAADAHEEGEDGASNIAGDEPLLPARGVQPRNARIPLGAVYGQHELALRAMPVRAHHAEAEDDGAKEGRRVAHPRQAVPRAVSGDGRRASDEPCNDVVGYIGEQKEALRAVAKRAAHAQPLRVEVERQPFRDHHHILLDVERVCGAGLHAGSADDGAAA
eukprot:scaffold324010_cov52-Tisochrysis_lutea.AAC.1